MRRYADSPRTYPPVAKPSPTVAGTNRRNLDRGGWGDETGRSAYAGHDGSTDHVADAAGGFVIEMEIGVVEVGDRAQSVPVVDRHALVADRRDAPFAQFAGHTVDV